ncbi:MAG TPA: polysaccharide deacetylase family protein [Gaiellaceae bacterium]|nr:polysaccharide deacetylase family protein [Gaiellaceae bacterium]
MIAVSVVIPTFNRTADLHRCLDALAAQTADPRSFEVVVVDDGSTDGTAAMAAGYRAPFELRIERQRNRGQTFALNRGIAVARGATCLFVDDDVVAEPELVAEHARAQAACEGVLAVGPLRLRNAASHGALARYIDAWWDEHYRRFETGEREPDFGACYSGNLSAPTAALRAAGGFAEELERSFDVELAYRLVQGGLRVVYVPRAGGLHTCAKGFRQTVRDFDRAGAAAAVLYERRSGLMDHPPLGDFSQGGPRAQMLMRSLLALRAPVWPLALLDRPLARRPPARLYRFLQLYCFWRSLRRALDDRDAWRRLTRGPVILMYHAIGDLGERGSRFVLPAARFRRQLAWLALTRRPILTLDEYVRHRHERRLPPARSVVLTFDDGYDDTAAVAAPLLARRRMPATVFLVSALLGRTNSWDGDGSMLRGRPLLSAAQARRLLDAGHAVGSHTVSHVRVAALDDPAARAEIDGSRRQLEQRLGVPIRHFAYPYGATSAAAVELVRAAGFDSAVGIEPGFNGPAVPLHRLRRLEVRGTRSIVRFALELWLGRPLRDPPRGS